MKYGAKSYTLFCILESIQSKTYNTHITILTANIGPSDGHSLLPNIDFSKLSTKMKTFGTDMAMMSIRMMRSRSYFD